MVGSTARALLPASMAGLPAKSAMVWVGPPLLARRPMPGSATPSRLSLLLRSTKAKLPTMLFAPVKPPPVL